MSNNKRLNIQAMTGFTSFASAHIDGSLLVESAQFGVLFLEPSSPVATFVVEAGAQRHPIWALNRLAVVVYAYTASIKRAKILAVEVNIKGSLVNGPNNTTNIVAASMYWHTSASIRNQAEKLIADMTKAGARKGEREWPTEKIDLPVGSVKP